MKKILFSTLLGITMIGCISTSAYASSEDHSDSTVSFDDMELQENDSRDLKVSDDAILSFESEDDKKAYINSIEESSGDDDGLSTAAQDPFREHISTKKPNGVFGGYITDNWAKSSKYTVSAGKSYGFSGSYQGVGLNFTFNNSVSTTVKANKSKYSKLGMYADYTVKKYKQYTPNMKPSYVYEKTVRDSYIKVVYK